MFSDDPSTLLALEGVSGSHITCACEEVCWVYASGGPMIETMHTCVSGQSVSLRSCLLILQTSRFRTDLSSYNKVVAMPT
jgi:hypothetical protein